MSFNAICLVIYIYFFIGKGPTHYVLVRRFQMIDHQPLQDCIIVDYIMLLNCTLSEYNHVKYRSNDQLETKLETMPCTED